MKIPSAACPWSLKDPLSKDYHDREWGVPQYDDRKLFEHLFMESMSCGLSWVLMLRKRAVFARNFCGFDPGQIAEFGEKEIAAAMADAEMIHAERKIRAEVNNARAFLALQKKFGSFADFFWSFTRGKTVIYPLYQTQRLTRSALSDSFSKSLKKHGFAFVGSVSMFSFLEACGVINDHMEICPRCAPTRAMNSLTVVDDPEQML